MAGDDTRPPRFYAYNPIKGKCRIPVPAGSTEEQIVESAQRWGADIVTREEGPTRKPTKTTVVWRREPRPEFDAHIDLLREAARLRPEFASRIFTEDMAAIVQEAREIVDLASDQAWV
jgi:hypothetical protein